MADSGAPEPLPWPDLNPIPPGWLDDTPAEAVARMRKVAAQRWAGVRRRIRATARVRVDAGERLRDPHLDDADIAARVRARLAGRAA